MVITVEFISILYRNTFVRVTTMSIICYGVITQQPDLRDNQIKSFKRESELLEYIKQLTERNSKYYFENYNNYELILSIYKEFGTPDAKLYLINIGDHNTFIEKCKTLIC